MICTNPIKIINQETKKINRYNCGKCINCKTQRALEWTNKLVDECTMHRKHETIVLTYRTEDQRKTKISMNHGKQKRTLWYPDVQKYLDRLRKDLKRNCDEFKGKKESEIFRYAAAGEYGKTEDFPHFHVVLFGINLKENGDYIRKHWPYGMILEYKGQNDDIRKEMGYVAGYIQKKLFNGKWDEWYIKRGQVPPRMWTSKGIGKTHALKYRDYYCSNALNYKPELKTHYGLSIPRSYIKWYKQQDIELAKKIGESNLNKDTKRTYLKVLYKNNIDRLIDKISKINRQKKEEMWDKENIIYDHSDQVKWPAKEQEEQKNWEKYMEINWNYEKGRRELINPYREAGLRYQEKNEITIEIIEYERKKAIELAIIRQKKVDEIRNKL